MRTLIKKLGYEFITTPVQTNVRLTQKRKDRIREFVKGLAHALKLEEEGSAVIVYMDESYIHEGACSMKAWQRANNEGVTEQQRSTTKGKMLIIVHAITKDGLLFKPGHERVDINAPFDAEQLSAEW